MSFLLEVKGWVNFEVEKTFDDLNGACRFGVERFSQNSWRVRDDSSDRVLYEHDPMQVIEGTARSEASRFERVEKFIQQQAERKLLAERQRLRLAQVARRQRRVQMAKRKKPQEVAERFSWMAEGF